MTKIIGFIFTALVLSANANAGTLTLTGSLSDPNAIQLFDLTFPTGSTGSITAQQVSFDPVLTLFASDGTLLIRDDDSGIGFDALLSGTLDAGSYILALTQFNFFPSSINDTYSGNSQRGLTWSVTFVGADDAIISARNGDVSAVPLPAAAWLFGSAMLGFAGLRRKSL